MKRLKNTSAYPAGITPTEESVKGFFFLASVFILKMIGYFDSLLRKTGINFLSQRGEIYGGREKEKSG